MTTLSDNDLRKHFVTDFKANFFQLCAIENFLDSNRKFRDGALPRQCGKTHLGLELIKLYSNVGKTAVFVSQRGYMKEYVKSISTIGPNILFYSEYTLKDKTYLRIKPDFVYIDEYNFFQSKEDIRDFNMHTSCDTLMLSS